MDTQTLKQILLEELEKYTGQGLNDTATLTRDAQDTLFSIITVAQIRGKTIVGTVLIARLLDDRIVIDRDQHDKPLVDALKARNVPLSQIVLTYRGESIPA